MSHIDLSAVKARLGSLSFEARSRLATASPGVFKLVTIDMPALVAEIELIREAAGKGEQQADELEQALAARDTWKALAEECSRLKARLALADAVVVLVEKYTKQDTLVCDLHQAIAAYRAAEVKP